jgi:nucleotidyltransferase/DNA polymerase involved in DNA repair
MHALALAPALDAATASDGAWPHLASLAVAPRDRSGSPRREPGWMAACYRLTTRVERVSARAALLDLGVCTDSEALAVMRGLLRRLAVMGLRARAGVGPSSALAQLAALTAPPTLSLALVTPAGTPAFLRRVPMAALAQLHPAGTDAITPEIVARLHHYGLRTLAQVARLSEPALCRQFGRAGAFLSAVAHGRDARLLLVTPRPAQQRFRTCFAPAARPEQVLAGVPWLAEQVALGLRQRGRQARVLRLRIHWESGSIQRTRLTLRAHTNDPALLAHEMRRLLARLHRPDAPGRDATAARAVTELRLTLGDFAPSQPEQTTFWRTRSQRRATIQVLAETLAQRHGRPLLFGSQHAIPAAIFAEEGYQLAPFGTATTTTTTMTGTQARHAPSLDIPDDCWQQVPQRLHWW